METSYFRSAGLFTCPVHKWHSPMLAEFAGKECDFRSVPYVHQKHWKAVGFWNTCILKSASQVFHLALINLMQLLSQYDIWVKCCVPISAWCYHWSGLHHLGLLKHGSSEHCLGNHVIRSLGKCRGKKMPLTSFMALLYVKFGHVN